MTILPPPQFDYPPTIPVIEHVMSYADVQAICISQAEIGANAFLVPVLKKNGVNGCASIYNGRCFIWRIKDDEVARHERAHCNGWPSDHSDHPVARVVPRVTLEKTTGGVVKPWPGEKSNE